MATYYWVGGAGTWNNSSTTNWATSSGGAGGAGVPTSADNVIFDTLSNATAYAVTVGTNAVAQDITIAGPLVGNVTITSGATAVINCYGSWLNAATGVTFSSTTGANITFAATTTGKTVTTNGISLGAMSATFNGVGGGWTLGSAWLATSNIVLTNGTLNTNGQTISCTIFNSSNSNTRTLTLGTSTINVSSTATPWNFVTTTGLTFSGASSTINCTGTSVTFSGGGLSYGTVNFTNAASGVSTISQSNTFVNLTQTSRSATGQRQFILSADQTVSGTLTLQTLGTPVAMQRTFVQSSTIGTQRTITAAAVSGLADVDFRDIVAAGAASWTTGTRIGNCLNNSGITFTAAADKYWSLVGGGNIVATAWALTAGGAPAVANFPLAQDRIVIVDTGLNSGAAINLSQTTNWNLGEITFASRTLPVTITASTNVGMLLHKNLTLSSAVTWSSSTGGAIQCVGQGTTQVITSAGVTVDQPFTVNSVTGTVQLNGDFTSALGTGLTHTSGTLDLAGYTLTALSYVTSSSIAHTLAFGTTGKLVLTGNNASVLSGSGGNLTVTGAAPLIQFSYSGGTGNRNIVMPVLSESQAISVEFINGASDIVFIQGTAGGYKNITFTSFTGSFQTANTPNIFGNLYTCNVMTATGTNNLTFAGTSGTQTITTAGASPTTLDFPITKSGASTLQLQTAVTMGSTRTFTFTSGTLELNGFDLSTGVFAGSATTARTINFGTNKIVVTGTNTFVFSILTATNLTLLGTPQVEATGAGTVGQSRNVAMGSNFASPEANAVSLRVSAGADTILLATTSSAYKNVEFTSGFTGTVQMSNAIQVYGNWSFSPNMVTPTTSTGSVTFASTNATPRTITSNGKAFGGSSLVFNGVGGSWQLQDNLVTSPSSSINLANGTLDLNNFGTTSGSFTSTGSTTRAVAFGTTGSITVTGTTATVFNGPTSSGTAIGISGNAQVYVTGAGPALGTRSINGGNYTVQLQHFSFTISAGADTISSTAGMAWENMTFTSGFTGILANVTRFVYGDVTFHSGMSLGSGTSVFTLAATSGPKTVTTAGLTLDFPVTFDGIGGTWAMQDALTLGSTRALTLTNGVLQLKSGTTSTVGSFVTPGLNQTYLQATTPGVQATISAPSGTYTATFITIQDSNATGGAVWQASNAVNPVNAGNNSGWNFAIEISGVAGTGNAGTVTSAPSNTLSGVRATGTAGTIYVGWRNVNTTQTQTWTPVITS